MYPQNIRLLPQTSLFLLFNVGRFAILNYCPRKQNDQRYTTKTVKFEVKV